jgi:hypothetical protein
VLENSFIQQQYVKKVIDLRSVVYSCKQGSTVSIVFEYGMDDRAISVRSPAEARGFFL